ncbi:MAG: hypothetical protein IPN68_17930 [Bacteroidetes bacterium]|nr:hypothetical protein [Bacteroidota bacterium]
MDLLFSVSNATKESKIGDSDFKKYFPSINQNMNWYSLEPYIRQATREYLLPYVGTDFYNDIVLVDGDFEGPMIEVAEIARDVVAYYTVWMAMPHINVVISDMGAQENSGSDGTSQPAQMWRYKNARWETMLQADKMIDRLLALLEKNINESDFSKWKDSDECAEVGHPLFRTTAELKRYTKVDSWRFFKALMPFFDQALDLDIVGHICREQYDDLVGKISSGNTYELAAIELIRKALANFTLHRAIPHLRVAMESNAIVFVSSTDGMNIKQAALDSAIDTLRAQLERDGREYLRQLKGYLYTNVEQFPIFEENGYVEDPGVGVIVSADEIGGIMIN